MDTQAITGRMDEAPFISSLTRTLRARTLSQCCMRLWSEPCSINLAASGPEIRVRSAGQKRLNGIFSSSTILIEQRH
jgi:hypothetical protein